MKLGLEKTGDRKGKKNETTEEDAPDPWPENLPQEKEEMKNIIRRLVEVDEVHKHVDEIPDDKDEAIELLLHTYLDLDSPYGSENGYDLHGFADIDEGLAWFLLQKELNVKPVRKPADHLSDSPFSVKIDTRDFGFFDSHNGSGFYIEVHHARHDATGKFLGRAKGKTKLYPTMLRAVVAAIDVARRVKQDWFSYRA